MLEISFFCRHDIVIAIKSRYNLIYTAKTYDLPRLTYFTRDNASKTLCGTLQENETTYSFQFHYVRQPFWYIVLVVVCTLHMVFDVLRSPKVFFNSRGFMESVVCTILSAISKYENNNKLCGHKTMTSRYHRTF